MGKIKSFFIFSKGRGWKFAVPEGLKVAIFR